MMAAERGPLRVVGRYALYNEIAAGGMATVHIGRLLGPVGFARTVAVKRLHPQFAKDPEFVSMFLDEARLAARIQHPNVVATIDVVATDGELFLIMDYIRGESLSKLVRAARSRGERIPPRIAASICCGFLHGLHSAHEAKNERGGRIDLVHRDISPQNVLVGADGIARVLDFGIAKAAGRIHVTREGQIKGKLAYMPPEQLSGGTLTRAVDIYASAVVMWESLTGERLFKGQSESETLAKILRDEVLPPSRVVPNLTNAYDAILLQALSRDPKARHATARELAFDLEKCLGVATVSEVGEWVETMVGTILSAREDQIAEVESHSAMLRLSALLEKSPSGRMQAESASDSYVMPLGGPQLGEPNSRPSPSGSDRPTTTEPIPVELPPAGTGALDEGTEPKVSGTRSRSAIRLPVDRKVPIVASALGLLVLLVIMGVVLLGRAPKPSAPAPGSSASAAEDPNAIGANPTEGPANPVPEPTETPTAAPAPSPHVGWRPPAPNPPQGAKPTAPVVPFTPPRRDCNPPYSIDANGRKKYKLECM